MVILMGKTEEVLCVFSGWGLDFAVFGGWGWVAGDMPCNVVRIEWWEKA